MVLHSNKKTAFLKFYAIKVHLQINKILATVDLPHTSSDDEVEIPSNSSFGISSSRSR